MNKQQLKLYVVDPALKEIPRGYSTESSLAIMMIIAHESQGGNFVRQVGGPALGIIQMEPRTHDDTWKHGDSIRYNAFAMGIIKARDCGAYPLSDRLIYDLRYNVFMARQRLFMIPEKLPTCIAEMSVYLNKHWNAGGKANDLSYANAYFDWSQYHEKTSV